jgi:uncharacterized damage-inducible protein DinB
MIYPLETLRELYAFNRWANTKTLESVGPLTAEEYERGIGGSFGSVRGTLVHLYGADWVWLERFRGRSPRAMPESDELATRESLAAKWREVQDAREAFLATLTPERLAGPLSYAGFDGKGFTRVLGAALFHVANHGTYHRGQVATLLRQLGKTPVSTDFTRYLNETAGS